MTRFRKIGIIGLGLIGGSIAKKLHAKGYALYTPKSKHKDVQKAKSLVTILPTLQDVANEVDLIIIASPLSTIIPIAKKIKAKHPLLVIDVGSVKTQIVKEFEKLTSKHVEFLSTHPMAGSEKQGFDASSADLFKEAPWIIVPHKKNKAKIAPLIRELGAKPIEMSAHEHDEKTALISHLPMILSIALWDFVQKKDPTSLQIAGPSFRSMTRLAHGNTELFQDIKKHNKLKINRLWKDWIRFLISK
ncbi:MAG: prephenate dehydrogenase/arogenate dehydrogenase family protein [Verrucomicrobia bacterium]|nr:prephenate dehydrogenase/arogenate dehydrogenase family protein [Verrucomicrobiota bacterium]